MAVLKCKMCGGDLVFETGATVCECEYCGSKQTIPNADNEKKMTLFARANRLIRSCEFDKAEGIFSSIAAEFPEEAEAYWGLVLCRYGIEYVDDPATGKKVPTCHRSSFDSVMDDADFDQVMENADTVARAVYREQAKQIEELRKGIIEVSGKEEPYDIFICYKETDENKERTLDSVLAQDIYDALTAKGYRVFFSRISLEDKLGVEYEPYIFAALNSAKVMLAIGTSYDYYNAVWVKNEWSRFLKLMAADKGKYLIPCYKDIDAYDIPKEFAKLQAQDLGKVGAIQDLLKGIEKLIGAGRFSIKDNYADGNSAVSQGNEIAALLKRAALFLEDGDWQNADLYCEKILDKDPENADSYLYKLMAKLQVRNRKDLGTCEESFKDDELYKKILRFGSGALREELDTYLGRINDRIKEKKYQNAIALYNKGKLQRYIEAHKLFSSLSNWKDADKWIEKCQLMIDAEKDKQRKHEAQRKEKEKLIDLISETLKNRNIDDPLQKAEDELAAAREKCAEYTAVMENYPAFHDEEMRIQSEICNVEARISILEEELSKLGFFAGKRKKEIASEMQQLQDKLGILNKQRKEILNKTGGRKKETLKSYVSQLQIELKVAEEKYREQKERTRPALSLAEAMESLKSEDIQKLLKKKHPFEYKLYTLLTCKVGDIVEIGVIGKDSIMEWIVLDKRGNEILLISKYVQNYSNYQYNFNHDHDATWETSSIRKSLNNDFYKKQFTEEEKQLIRKTKVTAVKVKPQDDDPGNDTVDRLFLLSMEEVETYFKNKMDRIAYEKSLPWKTEPPKARSWWLRNVQRYKSYGENRCHAAYVDNDGSIEWLLKEANETRFSDANKSYERPAMWLDLG